MILAGKTAIVTGGGVRIGQAIALHLARHGANIGLHYGSSREQAEETARQILELGRKVALLPADLRTPTRAASLIFDRAAEELGPVEILINNASIFRPGTLQSTEEADWDDHLNINLKAPFFLTRKFAEQLPAGVQGSVINITDWRGEFPVPGHSAYTIAKAGLIAQTRLLAQEQAPGIRINAISPGAILPATDGSTASFQARGSGIPLKRTGSPADILHAIDYLLAAPFVTGEVLHVTGGEELMVGFQNRSNSKEHGL